MLLEKYILLIVLVCLISRFPFFFCSLLNIFLVLLFLLKRVVVCTEGMGSVP